jgi:drug/metabolite transporter (DMT)-like permease
VSAVDAAPATLARADRPVLGIAAMVLTVLAFTLQDACVKLLGGIWPLPQIMLGIGATAAVLLGVTRALQGGVASLRSRHPRVQAARAVLLPVCALGSFYAYANMPLAGAYAINFVQPLAITALSVPLLGEKVGWRRWTAVAVGFLGVLIILRPGSGLLGAPGLAMLGASFFAATTIALLRKAPLDPPLVSAFWTNLGVAGGGLALLPFAHVTPSGPELATVVTAGLLAAAAFSLQAVSLRAARAAVVAPFQYVQILFGLAVGALLFGDPPPDRVTALGALIVIGSGLYVLHRETRRRGAGG